MTPTITNVLAGAAPVLKMLTRLPAILSMAIIPFYSWFNFNTWTGDEFKLAMNNPPRHYTTFSRYVWYSFLYTMFLELVYIIILMETSITSAVCLYRRLSIKRRTGLAAGSSTFVFGPRTDISIGAATGYLAGFAIIMVTDCPQEVGTDVVFNINDIGAIDAVVKRKEEENTFLQLFPNDEMADRLASYLGIGGFATAHA